MPAPAAGAPLAPGGVPPAAPLSAPAPTGATSLISVRAGGGFAGGSSVEPSISANGRWVAFTSGAADLVAGDTNKAIDVFVRDRSRGTTVRLGLPGGLPVPPGGRAAQPSVSADGSVVAFAYWPAPADGMVMVTPRPVVLVWTRATGAVEVLPAGQGMGATQPSVSGDGRYVAFVMGNSDLSDVYRYDRTARRTALVTVGVGGGRAAGRSGSPAISADGNVVAFVSDGGDTLVPESTGSGDQVYARDMAAGVTERISGPAGGGPADGTASAPRISADGRYVAFASLADNLVAGDANGASDVFLRDRSTGTTSLVSVTPDGLPARGPSAQPAISADGRMVAFASTAPDLVAGLPDARLAADVKHAIEVYIRDVVAGDTVLVSATPSGEPGGGESLSPAVAGNGRFIAFSSTSPRLVPGDGNELADVFLRDLPPVPRVSPTALDFGIHALGSPPEPGAATVVNAGWGPLRLVGPTVVGAAAADFTVSSDSCRGAVLHRGEACTVTVAFGPTATGARTASLEVAHGYTGSPLAVGLRGVGSRVQLALDPPVGPPGTVVVVSGSGFPPGAQVALSWTAGITPKLPIATADAGGGFRVQVLVFHNDVLGPRSLEAQPAGAAIFEPVTAPMLVSAPSAMPPGFALPHRVVDIPLALVIRG